MNNTKWNELCETFWNASNSRELDMTIPYRTRWNGYESGWDLGWEHFGCMADDYKSLEWLQIQLTPENRRFVLDTLHRIHVPGEVQGDTVIVYGHAVSGDYL